MGKKTETKINDMDRTWKKKKMKQKIGVLGISLLTLRAYVSIVDGKEEEEKKK